jgi:multidrug resistance efflux pump
VPLAQLPEVPDAGGADPWLVALAIIMPVVGVVVSAWLGARRSAGREDPEEQALKDKTSEEWQTRAELFDELVRRVATVTQARDAAVQAAEDAHAHKIAAELARKQAEAKEHECQTKLEQMQSELAQLRAILRGLKQA